MKKRKEEKVKVRDNMLKTLGIVTDNYVSNKLNLYTELLRVNWDYLKKLKEDKLSEALSKILKTVEKS